MTDPLSESALAELVRLEKEATPGDWAVKFRDRLYVTLADFHKARDEYAVALVYRRPSESKETQQATAALIVAMRNAIGPLVAELQALRAERGYHCNPLFPGDPSMCFGDEQTCRCLNEDEQSKAARAAGG